MTAKYKQLYLNMTELNSPDYYQNGQVVETNGHGNKLAPDDNAFHDWYRFVLSYPAHLVSYYLNDFGLRNDQVVLDPFCGTGTTLIQARLNQIESVGIEANPFAYFASKVKVDWDVNPDHLIRIANEIAKETTDILREQGIDERQIFSPINSDKLRTLREDETKLILEDSISPLPLHKALVLLDAINLRQSERCFDHLRLAFAKNLVFRISNLHFGPEVGIGKAKQDAEVVGSWFAEVKNIAADLQKVRGKDYPQSRVYLADARNISQIIEPTSIDAVITSPPYPNEKDYTRTTRLESVILGFILSKEDLRKLKHSLIRSNTRGVYKEDNDDEWIAGNQEIQRIAEAIENRRIELGKTSGFEKLYGRVTKLYFGGMARHLSDLRIILRPGARLAYVVGDQASYLRVMIHTGQILADIAKEIGYEVVRIDLFRKRFSTTTKQDLREEVVILKWKG
jgi:SAM-dependent methyltransferase